MISVRGTEHQLYGVIDWNKKVCFCSKLGTGRSAFAAWMPDTLLTFLELIKNKIQIIHGCMLNVHCTEPVPNCAINELVYDQNFYGRIVKNASRVLNRNKKLTKLLTTWYNWEHKKASKRRATTIAEQSSWITFGNDLAFMINDC